jgi:crotonobetainyl-CoA:carnitine CoA-transferase CaiB-like acyl-CoA transferase
MIAGRAAPLADVRILALEQFGAGPFGSMHLAALGADVIKIELHAEGGDIGRSVPPYAGGGDSLFFQAFNANKRSVAIDIRKPRGRAAFEKLVARSDAVYSNLRGGVTKDLRIGFDDLRSLNKEIVCCSLSAFGEGSGRARDPGYDYVLQAIAGWMSLTGDPQGPPAKSGLSLVDYCGGLVAALALVSGLHAARRTGVGCNCDLSLFDTAISMLTYPGVWWLNEGYQVQRLESSAHPSLVPFQAFRTADRWMVIACAKEKFWQRLAEALEHEEWISDPRFLTFAERYENRKLLVGMIEDALACRSAEHWVDVLGRAGIPCGGVNNIGQALADVDVTARELVVEVAHPERGSVRLLRSPVVVGSSRSLPVRCAPTLGADTENVLSSLLGYDSSEISAVVAESQ